MKKKSSRSPSEGNLHRQAAHRLPPGAAAVLAAEIEMDVPALKHEHQEHQIKQEILHEELRRAQSLITTLKARCQELYDFAPIGYLTLDAGGHVLEANFSGAALLGIGQCDLINRSFPSFLSSDSQAAYRSFSQRLLEAGAKQTDEFCLPQSDGTLRYLKAEVIPTDDVQDAGRQIRLTIQDITERKQADQMAQQQTSALIQTLKALKTQPEMDEFLEQVLTTLAQSLNADMASVWLYHREQEAISLYMNYEGGRILTAVQSDYPAASNPLFSRVIPFWAELIRTRQPLLVDRIEEIFHSSYREWLLARGVKTVLAVPMLLGDEPIGWLGIRSTVPRHYQPAELELAQALAQQTTLVVQMTRLAEQGRQAAILQERNRIAQDIHDTLAQGFTGILVQLEAAAYAPEQEQARVHIAYARDLARQSLQEARRSVHALRPHTLEGKQLLSALAHLIRQSTSAVAVSAKYQVQGTPYPLLLEVENHIIRIVQEALTNAIKHSEATKIQIELSYEPAQVQICVQDNGKGFVVQVGFQGNGFGLIGMYERAELIGGRMALVTRPGQGTSITLTLPKTPVRTEEGPA